METENNQPTQRPVTQPAQPVQHHNVTASKAPGVKSRRPRRKVIAVSGTLVVLVAIGLFWSWWLFGRNTSFNENKNIKTSEYQAVFLTNGQVYFGKLANLNNKYVTITDVYYLQVQSNSSLQGASSS